MTPSLRREAEVLVDKMCEHPDIWLTHGLPHFSKLELITGLIEAFAKAQRREEVEAIKVEIGRNETVSPHIGPLWNAGWTERSQSIMKWLSQRLEELGDGQEHD